MGVVYRAWDPSLERWVAMKLLEAGHAGSPSGDPDEALRRFEREARAAAKLRHSGIVAVHEVGADERGRPFIVMDLVDGTSFEERLREGRPTLRRIAEVVREVAIALDHAHGQGVVHRDVKPENILIDRAGGVHLTDFGLARDVEPGDDRLTRSGQILGTPAYLAPEQAGSSDRGVGAWTDVYGLGGVLYRALVGRPPFEAPELVGLLRMVLFDEPAPPRAADPAIHPDLETITLRCLEKEPGRRYGSAAALADDLRRFVDGELIQARRAGRVERARRWASRNRVAATAVAALVLVVAASVAVGAGLLVEMRRRVESDRQAVIDAARERAGVAVRGFELARRSDDAETDAILGLGLAAAQAAATWSALATDDPAAGEAAFDAMLAYGEAALAAEQWGVAAAAFEQARLLGTDPARSDDAVARVGLERARAEAARAAAVDAVLGEARSGALGERSDGHEDAVFALVRHPDTATVAQLAAALDQVTDRLRDATAAFWRSAAEPDEDERRLGEGPIAGLDEAVARILVAPPGEAWSDEDTRKLTEADRRLTARAARGRSNERFMAIDSRRLRGDVQARVVEAPELALARLCCDALGRIGIAEVAVPALGRYLFAEWDQLRAVPAAVALARLGDDEATRLVLAVRSRFGSTGPLWQRIAPRLARLDIALPEATTTDLLHRANAHLARGDHAAALAEVERALELDPDDAIAWTSRGVILGDRGDLADAIVAFGRAIELDPESVQTLRNRATAYRDHGNALAAANDIDRAIELDPNDARVWVIRSLILKDLEKLELARESLDRAIALDPFHADAWRRRGVVRESLGDLEGALADLSRAITLAPEHLAATRDRIRVRTAAGDHDGARKDADRLIDARPNDGQNWRIRASLRDTLGDLEGAAADYERATVLAPGDTAAWRSRATIAHELGRLPEALEHIDRAVELAPRSAASWRTRGVISFHLGTMPEAIQSFDRALAIAPDDATALGGRGAALWKSGEPRRALADLDRAIELVPGSANLHLNRANPRMELGDLEGAKADLDRAIALDADAALAWSQRGLLRDRMGDLDGAIADQRRAIELAPSSAAFQNNLAWALYQAGRLDEAIVPAERALALDPNLFELWDTFGEIQAARGESAAAIEAYERCLAIDPKHPGAGAVRERLAKVRSD